MAELFTTAEHPNPFTQVENRVYKMIPKPFERAVFMALLMHVNQKRGDGGVWPSINTLAKEAGMGRDAAIKSLKRLEELGVIEKYRRGGVGTGRTTNLYFIKTCYLIGPLRGAKSTKPTEPQTERAKSTKPEAKSTKPTQTIFNELDEEGLDIYEGVDIEAEVEGGRLERVPPAHTLKPPEREKHPYAFNVLLTEAEYDVMVQKHGEETLEFAIEVLSGYKESKGRRYKSDAGALRSWAIQAAYERLSKLQKLGERKPNFKTDDERRAEKQKQENEDAAGWSERWKIRKARMEAGIDPDDDAGARVHGLA